MKVLVATKKTQGQRPSDFCWTEEGEYVNFTGECDTDGDHLDGTCGCKRSMSGITSQKSTTTFMVADHPINEEVYRAILTAGYAPWGKYFTPDALEEFVNADYENLTKITKQFKAGDILEKRGHHIWTRKE